MTNMRMLGMDQCTPLFQAAAEATEEAIWNAMIAAETMTGLARAHGPCHST